LKIPKRYPKIDNTIAKMTRTNSDFKKTKKNKKKTTTKIEHQEPH